MPDLFSNTPVSSYRLFTLLEFLFLVFKGNVAADDRPDPLASSDEGDNSDDDDVRQEMIKVLNNDM